MVAVQEDAAAAADIGRRGQELETGDGLGQGSAPVVGRDADGGIVDAGRIDRVVTNAAGERGQDECADDEKTSATDHGHHPGEGEPGTLSVGAYEPWGRAPNAQERAPDGRCGAVG